MSRRCAPISRRWTSWWRREGELMRYDLVLKGGTPIDPARGRDGVFDLAVADGKITAIEPSLDASQAARVVDVSGKLVLPGLLDLHAHVFHRMGIGADPDRVCLANGTTTAADGGSA